VIRGERASAAADVEAAAAVGEALALELLEAGAAEILGAELRPLEGLLFLLPRTRERASRIAPALRSAGADVVEARDAEHAAEALAGRVPDVLLFPSSGSVATIAGYLGTLRARARRPIVATMGESSSRTASEHGFPPDLVSPEPAVAAFVQSVTQYVLEKV
jgi:uroporphyrinogen-III synthase